ncbi:hypothetical protein CCP4SC76_6240026 [Gammaproteobacteria bacterium]
MSYWAYHIVVNRPGIVPERRKKSVIIPLYYCVFMPSDRVSDQALDSLVLPFVNADTMSIFLTEVAARHPNEEILMILDGASWHSAIDLVSPSNMSLELLPSYSPELNPVEHIWEEIREKWFHNEVFLSLDAVEQCLIDSLVTLEASPSRVQPLAGFSWIVSIPIK